MKKSAIHPAPSAPAPSSVSAQAIPSYGEIATRAEALWREKGCPPACDDEIWLEAEQQLFRQRRPEQDKRDVISNANPRFKIDEGNDNPMREFDERFSEPTGKETTSL
jgi:hypothetical protein